jgi:hypothetical protein
VIEVAIQAHHLAADRLEHLRRERPGRAIAAGTDHLEAALDLRAIGEIGDVARGKFSTKA